MRQAIQILLQGAGFACVQAVSTRDIRARIDEGQIQVWITDSVLPEIVIEELIRTVRLQSSRTEILLLTPALNSTETHAEDLTRWIEAGATDFMVKPFDRSALVGKVQALIRRLGLPKMDSDQTLSMGELVLNPATFDVYCGLERTPLTPSEFKLLHALMLRQGAVLSRDQLIALVQGAGIAVIDRAVDTHVASLRKKLGSCSEWIETVRGVGYRIRSFPAGPPSSPPASPPASS